MNALKITFKSLENISKSMKKNTDTFKPFKDIGTKMLTISEEFKILTLPLFITSFSKFNIVIIEKFLIRDKFKAWEFTQKFVVLVGS
ncbi:CLUMA_CG015644, isoform A [Clunio marinus]|uniref:CLUMA_CG015644, isoform A n=1 Tax=Clunio marinus TaxID=568069 RepID=A0A1J1IUS2_9DIPT|nr:CLUMA_CG015644, isoform A [Clunio marinus]